MSATAPQTPEVPTLPGPDAPERAPESELDDIDIQVEDRLWQFKGEIPVTLANGDIETRAVDRSYTQRPMSYIGMLQFTGYLGERVQELMGGADGVSLDRLMSGVDGDAKLGDARDLLARADFIGLDRFVQTMTKVAAFAPGFIEECQCIWLQVPHAERAMVKLLWSQSPESGGLSVEDGVAMLDLFLAQNYQELEDFFVVRLPRMGRRWRAIKERSRSGGARRR